MGKIIHKLGIATAIIFILSVMIGTVLTVIHRNESKTRIIDEILVLTPFMTGLIIIAIIGIYELIKQWEK